MSDTVKQRTAHARAEHTERIERALDALRQPHGMAQMLRASWIKGGKGSLGNMALMGDQAPGQLVENHYGWSDIHGLGPLPKGCGADLYLSNAQLLPVPCWSVRRLAAAGFIASDYADERLGVVPAIDAAYCEGLAESWREADDQDRTPVSRLRLLNAWGKEVKPRPAVADHGEGLGSPSREEVAIPF